SFSDNARIEEGNTQKIGKIWLSSFSVSYKGIPLRERFLRINIGALSGEVMLVRNNIPSKTPNVFTPKVAAEDITQQAINLLGIHTKFESSPQLVFIDERNNLSLKLCYEVTASDPDMHEEWRLSFDALTGESIEKKSLIEQGCFHSGSEEI